MVKIALSLARLLCLFSALFVAFPKTTEARIIGIVHDDSGSMTTGGTVHLPAFGPQFIISTLDGQTNPTKADKLFYARLNDNRIIRAPITSQSAQQGQIDQVRTLFTRQGGNTPVDMVARMLTEIVNEGRPNEEIYLVVVTDGAFALEGLAGLRSAVQRAAQQAKGPVRSEFVLINPDNDTGTLARVRSQDVYGLLNGTFNGDPEEGFHNVTSFDQMFEAMRGITARISGTEDVGQGNKITVSGDTMTLDSPFSISRIVAVSSSDSGGTPPKVTSKSFTETQSYIYNSSMAQGDMAPGWNRRLSGLSQHFTFQPALPPGQHTVTFDQSLGRNSFLLFESDAVVELEILDRNGVALTPNANGVIEVSLNEDYDLQAQVFSQQSAGSPVPFSELDSGASFKSDVTSPAGAKSSLPMSRNASADRAEGSVTFTALGEHGLQAVLRWPGFVSPTSQIKKISVVDRRASLALTIDPIVADAQGRLIVDVAPPGTPVPMQVGIVTVTDAADTATGAFLALEGAPDWVTLEGPGGQPLTESDMVRLGDAIAIVADGSQIDSGDKMNPPPFKILAEAAMPARGTAAADVTLFTRLAEAKVVPTGHSKDATGATPLVMTGTELSQNRQSESGGIDALDFEIRDTLNTPEIGTNVTIIADPPFGLRLRAEISGNTVSVFPETSWWCPCALYFTGRPTDVAVQYNDGKGLQRKTSASQVVDANVTWREAVISCLLILGLLLCILYLIKALLNGLATQRFPKRSIAEVDDGRELTRKPSLRGKNFTFFKVLLWPFYGVPHEKASIDGLVLQARRGGAHLILPESDLKFESDTYDDLKEFREENPKKQMLPIGWLEEFRSTTDSDKIIRLLRDIGESR